MKLVVANFKMNLTLQYITEEYIKKLNHEKFKNQKVVICPSYPFIPIMSLLLNKQYYIGSQDVSMYTEGNYTGDVSANQLNSINTNYCIVGHSERRLNYSESPKQIVDKINNLQKYDIIPIICVGENNTRDKIDVLKLQLNEILPFIKTDKELVIAYEPIYSIGTGIVSSIEDIKETIKYIKKLINERGINKSSVIYGGSVNEENCCQILNDNIVDGILVGNNSINADKFIKLLRKVEVLDEK